MPSFSGLPSPYHARHTRRVREVQYIGDLMRDGFVSGTMVRSFRFVDRVMV